VQAPLSIHREGKLYMYSLLCRSRQEETDVQALWVQAGKLYLSSRSSTKRMSGDIPARVVGVSIGPIPIYGANAQLCATHMLLR